MQVETMVEVGVFRNESCSKFLIELECWCKEDQYQKDLIVQQILHLLDDEELCKVKSLKGVFLAKNSLTKDF
jgi:hypothetical protein